MTWHIEKWKMPTQTVWRFVIYDLGETFVKVRFISNDAPNAEARQILKHAYEEVYVQWTKHRADLSQPNDSESLRQLGFDLPSPKQWEPVFEDRGYSGVSG